MEGPAARPGVLTCSPAPRTGLGLGSTRAGPAPPLREAWWPPRRRRGAEGGPLHLPWPPPRRPRSRRGARGPPAPPPAGLRGEDGEPRLRRGPGAALHSAPRRRGRASQPSSLRRPPSLPAVSAPLAFLPVPVPMPLAASLWVRSGHTRSATPGAGHCDARSSTGPFPVDRTLLDKFTRCSAARFCWFACLFFRCARSQNSVTRVLFQGC